MTVVRQGLPRGGGRRRIAAAVRGWSLWALPLRARVFICSVILAAAAVAVVAAARTSWPGRQIAVFLALLACGLLAIESTRGLKEVHGAIGRDLQTVWYLAIAVTLPPACALLAPVPFTAYKLWRVRRGFVYRRVFSNATISLAYGAASLMFEKLQAAGVEPAPTAGPRAAWWAAAVAACGVVSWVINNGLLIAAIKLADRSAHPRDLVGDHQAVVYDVLELSLAVSVAFMVAVNPLLMILALPSVLLYRNYLVNAQLAARARLDAKTGLLKHSTWQQEAEVEFLRALRKGTPLALAVITIDHFDDADRIMENAVREKILGDIATMIKDQMPSQNLIGRFTGDAFVIMFPDTGQDEARKISERLRDHIAGEPIAIESGAQNGFIFRLTVSIGIAVLTESRRGLSELIGAAGTALAQARRTGWNKVYVSADAAGEDDPPGAR